MLRSILLLALIAAPAMARDRLPQDAPYCARPGTRPVFLSPMGEPFRAAPGQAYPSAMWLAAADRNHDGMVDRGEFIADAQRFFRTLDHDHDGRLTPEEVIAYERDVAPEIALFAPRSREMGPAPGGRRFLPNLLPLRAGESDYEGPMGAGAYAWLNIPEPVVAADSDVDRIITEKEFLGAAGRRFEQLDPEGKGGITLKGMPKTANQQSIEGPCRPLPKPRTKEAKDHDRDLREDERDSGRDGAGPSR